MLEVNQEPGVNTNWLELGGSGGGGGLSTVISDATLTGDGSSQTPFISGKSLSQRQMKQS